MDSEAPPSSINDGTERSVRVDEEGPTEVVDTARPTDASEMSEDDGLQQPLEVDDLRAAGGSAVLSTSFPLEQQLHTNNGDDDDDDDDDDAPSPTNFASRPSMRGNNRIEVQVGEEKPQQLNDVVDDDDDDDDDDVGGAPACLPSGSAAVLSPDYANEPIMLNQSNTSSNDQMIVPSGAFAPPLRADDDDDDAQHDGPPMDVGEGGAVMMVASEEWQTWAESDRSSPEPTNFGTRPSVHGKSETDAHDAEKGPQRHHDELDDDDERTEAPSPPNVATTPSMHAQEDANKVQVGEEKPQQLNDEVDDDGDDDVSGAPACLPSGSAAVLSPDYANEPIMLNQSNTSSNDQMIVPSGAFAPPLRADDDDDDDAQHDGPPMDVGDGGVPPMVASEEWQTCAESDASAPAPANFGAQTSMPGKNSTDVDISADSTAPHHDDGVSAAAAADDDTPAMHVVPSSSSQCGGTRATPILEEHPSTNLLMSGGSLRSTTTPKQILYAHEGGQYDGDGEVDVPFSSRLHQEATKQMILTEPAIASEESQQLAGDEDDDEAPSPTNFAARSSMHAQEDANKVEVGEEKPQQLNDVVDDDDDDDVGGAPTCLPSGSAAVLSPDYANEPIMLSRSFGPSADDAPKPCRVGDDDHHDDAYPRSQDAAEMESNPEMKREDHDANLASVGPSNSTTNNTHALMDDDDDDDDAPAVVHAVRATTDDVVEHGDDEGRSSIHREDADDGVEAPVVVSASIRVDTQQHADEDDRDHDADDDVHEEVVGVVVDGAQEVPPVEEEQRSESAAANDAAMELIEEVMKDVREEEDDDVEDEVVHPSSQDDVANDLHPANSADDDAPPPHVVASPSPEELSPSPPAMLRPCGTNSHDASAELSAQRCALSTVEVLVEIDGPVSSASAHSHELMGRDVDEGAEASTEEDFLHPCSNESPAGATDDDGDDEPLEENDATQDGSNRYDASASMELIDGRSTQPISSAYKEMRVDDGGRPSTSPEKLDDHDDENGEHQQQKQQQQVDDDGAHVPDDEEEQQDDDVEGDDDGTSAHEEPQHEDEEGISNGSPAQTSSPPPSRIEGDASPSETEKTAAAAEELADEDKMMMMMEESHNNNNKNNNGATTKRCAPPTHHFYSGRAVDVNPATFSSASPLDSAMVADYDTILSVRLKSHLTSNALASYYRSTTRSPGVRDANAAAPPLTRAPNASPSTHVPTNMMKDIHISTPASQPDDDNDTSLLVRRAMESLSDRGRAMPALMGDVPLSKRCFQRDDEVGRRVRAMRAMTREGEANAELTTLGGMLLATTHRLRQMGRYDGCRAIYPNKVNDVPQKITPAYCRAHPLTDDVANE